MDFGDEERALFAAAPKQLPERARPSTDIVAPAQPNTTTAIARRLIVGGAVAGIAAAAAAQPAMASEIDTTAPDDAMRTLSADLLSAPVTLVLPDYTSLLTPPQQALEPRGSKPEHLPSDKPSAHEQTINLDNRAEPASASMPLSSALAEPQIVTVDTVHTPPAPLRFVARAAAHLVDAFSEAPVIGSTARSASEAMRQAVEPLPNVPPTVLEQAPVIGRTILTAPAIITDAEAPLTFVTRGAQVLSPNRKIADRHHAAKNSAEQQHEARSRASIMKEMERKHYRNGNLPDYDKETGEGVLVALDGPFKGHKLHKDVVPSLLELNKAFKEKFGHNLKLNDSYRSYEDQVKTKQKRGKYAAKPRTSKHGWGIAIDIDDVGGFGSEKYKFLREAGKKYGWDNPKGLRDGIDVDEFWHFEYYGANVAPSEIDTASEENAEVETPSQPSISDLLALAPVQTIAPIETAPLITPDTTQQSDAQTDAAQSDANSGSDQQDNQASNTQTDQHEGQLDQSLIDRITSAPVQTIVTDTGINPSSGSNENGDDVNQETQPNASDITDAGNETQPKESDNSKVAEQPRQQERKADRTEYSKETLLKAADRLQQRGGKWVNRAKSMRFFLEHDLKPIHAASITGNFIVEGDDDDPDTDINPRAKQGGGGAGRGIAQWTEDERWQTHLRFCEKRKLDPWSMEAQLQFTWYEMEQGNMVSRMKGTTTIEDAVYRFERDFERAGKPAYKKRNKAAHEVHDALLEEAHNIQNGQ